MGKKIFTFLYSKHLLILTYGKCGDVKANRVELGLTASCVQAYLSEYSVHMVFYIKFVYPLGGKIIL